MKNFFSLDVYRFRWQHYYLADKIIDITIYSIGALMALFGIVDIWIDFGGAFPAVVFAGMVIILYLMAISLYRQGRFDQKYLKEMNEIRVNLGRKPMKDW